jgi:phenylacetate-coenzyme A ligase PaaK-like adenylate-forming protein
VVRKLLQKDIRLRKEILLSDRLPCFIGQCSPQQFYVRENKNKEGKKEIEITVMNLKAVAPNIKYVIGDEGGVIKFTEICKILKKNGYPVEKLKQDHHIPAIIPFQFLYLYGRSNGTVTVNGALISPSEIEEAILSDPGLVSAIQTFKLSVEPDTDGFIRLFIFLETRNRVQISDSLIARSHEVILNGLKESNECFRNNISNYPGVNTPVIRIFPFRSGVFAGDEGFIKNIYLK